MFWFDTHTIDQHCSLAQALCWDRHRVNKVGTLDLGSQTAAGADKTARQAWGWVPRQVKALVLLQSPAHLWGTDGCRSTV